jgi:hypothetical protein
MEEREWNKPFCNALNKLDKKKFDEMFGMPIKHRKKRWSGWNLNS